MYYLKEAACGQRVSEEKLMHVDFFNNYWKKMENVVAIKAGVGKVWKSS